MQIPFQLAYDEERPSLIRLVQKLEDPHLTHKKVLHPIRSIFKSTLVKNNPALTY